MRGYLNKPMEDLAAELKAGLLRLRKGYVDAAEALLRIVGPDREYPYEFVVYRLTGYRPRRSDLPEHPMTGQTLRPDLQHLMLDICNSFRLRTTDYAETVHDTDSLARRFRVSTKTIQRWCRRGLPARRLVFPDRKHRVAFLESSVSWFVDSRRGQILRSTRFSQMTEEERSDIIRRARRVAALTDCCLNDVTKRLAARTGRASETIRYTIRRHDREHPDQAVFPSSSRPLTEQDKDVIYRCFLRGVAVPSLAKRYDRTRGTIYRVINEMRARQLLKRSIDCMYNPQFDLPNADEIILSGKSPSTEPSAKGPKPPPDLPAYLRALYQAPLLNRQEEGDLFRRYNYLKHKADKLREKIDVNHIRTAHLKKIEAILLQANAVKNRIIRSNLRLVVSIAKKHLGGPQTLFELISDGNVTLMKAVERFDYSRGNRFSTYASWAIMRNYARSVPKERFQLDRFATGYDELLDIAAGLRSYDPNEINIPELRESIDVVLAQLSPRERSIVIGHYGLDETRSPKTLEQLSRNLGISKERVRQIEIQALRKLRDILNPQKADLLA